MDPIVLYFNTIHLVLVNPGRWLSRATTPQCATSASSPTLSTTVPGRTWSSPPLHWVVSTTWRAGAWGMTLHCTVTWRLCQVPRSSTLRGSGNRPTGTTLYPWTACGWPERHLTAGNGLQGRVCYGTVVWMTPWLWPPFFTHQPCTGKKGMESIQPWTTSTELILGFRLSTSGMGSPMPRSLW